MLAHTDVSVGGDQVDAITKGDKGKRVSGCIEGSGRDGREGRGAVDVGGGG